jgi:hypothetical protein
METASRKLMLNALTVPLWRYGGISKAQRAWGATIREARMLCTCVCPQSLCSLTLDIQSVSHNLGLTVRPRGWFDENFVAERSSQAQESPLTLSDAQRPLKGDETRSMRTSAVLFFLETMPIHKLR